MATVGVKGLTTECNFVRNCAR